MQFHPCVHARMSLRELTVTKSIQTKPVAMPGDRPPARKNAAGSTDSIFAVCPRSLAWVFEPSSTRACSGARNSTAQTCPNCAVPVTPWRRTCTQFQTPRAAARRNSRQVNCPCKDGVMNQPHYYSHGSATSNIVRRVPRDSKPSRAHRYEFAAQSQTQESGRQGSRQIPPVRNGVMPTRAWW